MSILKWLTREHRLFEKLIERLRRAAEHAGDDDGQDEGKTLEALLAGLERHDELEDALFGAPLDSAGVDERRARELVDAQHEALQALTAEVRAALGAAPCRPARLRALGEVLAGKLEWHFKTEELLLWPHLAKAPSRSLEHSLERRAEASARELASAEAALARAQGAAEAP